MRWTRKQRTQHARDVAQVHVQQAENLVNSVAPDWVARQQLEMTRMQKAYKKRHKTGE